MLMIVKQIAAEIAARPDRLQPPLPYYMMKGLQSLSLPATVKK
ncbi:hypothetical protein ALON55S_05251 [Alishewanella longhuensis]